MGDMNGAGPEQERLAPRAAERGDVRRIRHDGSFESVELAKLQSGHADHFAEFGIFSGRLMHGRTRGCAVVYETEKYFSLPVVWDDVRRAPAFDGPDIDG